MTPAALPTDILHDCKEREKCIAGQVNFLNEVR